MTNQDTYREHTVGSHSDDRGGDSDLPCYCDRRINQDTTSIDEQIIELLKDFNGYDFCGEKACSSQAKASELIKYLKALISDQVTKARLDELKRAKSLYSRTYKQEVTDNVGNVYVNDSHGYISSYEIQERIAELKAQQEQL